MNYWLFKCNPDQYTFEDLRSAPDSTDCWNAVEKDQPSHEFGRKSRKAIECSFTTAEPNTER